LARDLRLARHYCDQILIHSLEGCVWQGFLPRLRSLEWANDTRPPQRDQPLLLPVDMREWLPEDDLVFVVLDAVATLDLGEFYRLYRADGHGRAAFEPEMMVALLLYGSCQGACAPIMPLLPGSGSGMRSRWAGCSARWCGFGPGKAWCAWAC
jgi:hypothetical protein